MKKLILVFLACVVASSMLFAQEKMEKKEMKKEMSGSHVMTGWLVDQMCGKKMGNGDAEKSNAKAAKHTKDCAVEESCAESGYGLVNNGKWFKFDEKGDKLAAEWLSKTDLKKNLMVNVKGAMDGDNIKVESITTASEKKMDMKDGKMMEKKAKS
ncbi:MAG: hypothetical protein WBD36_08725 [Bacteroidota bacterium]